MNSAIYETVVRHKRFKPMGHELKYGVWSMLIDLDDIDGAVRRIPILSRNRFNLVAFHDKDHGPRDGSDLRAWFTKHVAEAGVDLDGGKVSLLVFPRILGYTFNPITVWFGHDIEGSLRAVMYEVHNTFGHSHSNLAILPKVGAGEPVPRHEFDKVLHVSPFFDQVGTYRVTLKPPSGEYGIVIEYLDADGSRFLTASQQGSRTRLTTRTLLRQFFTKPLLTLKVIAGIHIEAFKLWRKGAKYRPIPAPPTDQVQVTYVEGALEPVAV